MADKDNEPLDDVEGLLTKIGTVKKEAPPAGGKDGEAAKRPAGTLPEPPSTSEGDFSSLLKKLGTGKKREKDSGPASSPSPTLSAEPREDPQEAPVVVTLDDLLEEEELPSTAADEVVPAAEPAVEIIDEDPRGAAWKKKPKPMGTADPARQPSKEPGTDAEEKIITVDQITDLSGLILPKSATFEVEELKLHSRVSAYDGQSIGSLPDEFDEIWKKELSKAGFKDLDLGDVVVAGEVKTQPAAKKFSIGSLFAAIRTEEDEYDAKKHGPLVDLSFTPRPGLEEIELYPVNEPYAYVRIIYDHATHEYTYTVIEPVLAEQEKDLLKEVKERLFETLDINTKDITREEARLKLREATNDVLQDYGIRLTPVQKEKLHYNMHKDFLGDGLIDPVMHDKYIEDISCDGVHTPIFAFHSSYESMKTTLAYHTADDLDSFVTKLAQRAGKYISIAEPILDATMQDGSRIQMTLGTEVTAHGSTFTIRKFKDEPITPTDLIEWHTFAPLSIAYIWLAVENGKSAIFAGGTASGKTTALNAISLFIPPMAKIVSLEDTREVKLPHPNWIPSVTRDSFDTAGRGEINMYELLRAAMRQRPEYIIVGEVRGKECQTLFQAMSTGHVTYSTTHADSVASVVHRIENPPMDVPRNMLSALDFICVQVQARVGGKRIRRNKQIVEILDIDPRTNELITNEVFKWRSATDEHTYSGKSYLLEEIMEAKGWDEGRMREELKRRQEVLEWMRIKKIRHYKDVAKTLISYHRDPETVIEKVRKDLYE
jgi:flagellar protein FlaI